MNVMSSSECIYNVLPMDSIAMACGSVDACNRWFHAVCVDLGEDTANLSGIDWCCISCEVVLLPYPLITLVTMLIKL